MDAEDPITAESPNGGGILRKDREAAGLTRRQLAALIGCSRSHLSNVENGHRPVTARIAAGAANTLRTTPDRYLP